LLRRPWPAAWQHKKSAPPKSPSSIFNKPFWEAELQSQFTTKQKQLKRLSEDLQADVNAERQDILGRVGRQMAEVVKKLAEDKNVDVVIDVTNVLYFKPSLDLTLAATAAYDKANPVAK
jgi:outer membrane protein